jgi:hypothetical protein
MNPRPQTQFSLFSKKVTLALQPAAVRERQDSRLEAYLHKSVLLKQIMSNKARTYRRISAAQNIATVVVSSLLLFVGFSGTDKITTYASWIHPTSREAIELVFNLLMFALFVIGILYLVFRFADKQASADRAVALLASLGNEIEDYLNSIGNALDADSRQIERLRTRYEAITETIPANTDGEFLRAKKALGQKETAAPRFKVSAQGLFDKSRQEIVVSAIILNSKTINDILTTLRGISDSYFLGGGLIRNAVWDFLHGYSSPTPIDDVDVIYFDPRRSQKEDDLEVNTKLVSIIPNLKWSSKNQARMHIANSEEPYASLEDAIAKWPETATAIIVRLDESGKLHFIAPYGFDDLLRMIVTHTPAFASKLHIVRNRVEEKQWCSTWPRLRVLLPEAPQPGLAVPPGLRPDAPPH